MERDIIIALDEGTTNAKAIAMDTTGNVVAMSSLPLSIKTPHEGWVEQEAELLVSASRKVIANAIQQVGVERVAGIAISVQRETAVGWYRDTGTPLNAAITWQCSRTADFCETLRSNHHAEAISASTGLPIAPLFSASKFKWLLDSIPNGQVLAQERQICLGTVDAWVLWNLTGGEFFYCDYSNASRTQLFNIHQKRWDSDLLELFGIPESALPLVKPSSSLFGTTSGNIEIPDGIPILSMVGDSHAALFGHKFGELGCVKATYGTGSSVMAPVQNITTGVSSIARTIAWHNGEHTIYGLEGNIAHTGDGVAWMGEVTGLSELPTSDYLDALNTLPASVDSTIGVYFVPALTGLGAPWWDEQARGVISGLTRGVTHAHLIRASLEAIAYQIADVIEVMKQHPGFKLEALMVDGGPTKNDWLMQYQADLLGVSVLRSNVAELSAIGAGLLALKAFDENKFNLAKEAINLHSEFKPDLQRHEKLQVSWNQWSKAVEKAKS